MTASLYAMESRLDGFDSRLVKHQQEKYEAGNVDLRQFKEVTVCVVFGALVPTVPVQVVEGSQCAFFLWKMRLFNNMAVYAFS